MIETREDYEKFKAHSLTIWKNDAVETIEALRAVARGSKYFLMGNWDFKEGSDAFDRHDNLFKLVHALPGWLLEEE